MKRLMTIGPRQGAVVEVDPPGLSADRILVKTRAVSVLMENKALRRVETEQDKTVKVLVTWP